MIPIIKIDQDHPDWLAPPKDSVEHVYSGLENGVQPFVVYRTKDSVTHKAIIENDKYVIVKSVAKF